MIDFGYVLDIFEIFWILFWILSIFGYVLDILDIMDTQCIFWIRVILDTFRFWIFLDTLDTCDNILDTQLNTFWQPPFALNWNPAPKTIGDYVFGYFVFGYFWILVFWILSLDFGYVLDTFDFGY